MANIVITVTSPDGRTILSSHTSHHDGFPVRHLLTIAETLHGTADSLVQDLDQRQCTCDPALPLTGNVTECPSCGIARSNMRQSDYWQRVGRD